jgi:hypothetical protein
MSLFTLSPETKIRRTDYEEEREIAKARRVFRQR